MGAITTVCMVIVATLTYRIYCTTKKMLSELKKFNG